MSVCDKAPGTPSEWLTSLSQNENMATRKYKLVTRPLRCSVSAAYVSSQNENMDERKCKPVTGPLERLISGLHPYHRIKT